MHRGDFMTTHKEDSQPHTYSKKKLGEYEVVMLNIDNISNSEQNEIQLISMMLTEYESLKRNMEDR